MDMFPRALRDVLMGRLQLAHHLLNSLNQHRLQLATLLHELLAVLSTQTRSVTSPWTARTAPSAHRPIYRIRPYWRSEEIGGRTAHLEQTPLSFKLRTRMSHSDEIAQRGLTGQTDSIARGGGKLELVRKVVV